MMTERTEFLKEVQKINKICSKESKMYDLSSSDIFINDSNYLLSSDIEWDIEHPAWWKDMFHTHINWQ